MARPTATSRSPAHGCWAAGDIARGLRTARLRTGQRGDEPLQQGAQGGEIGARDARCQLDHGPRSAVHVTPGKVVLDMQEENSHNGENAGAGIQLACLQAVGEKEKHPRRGHVSCDRGGSCRLQETKGEDAEQSELLAPGLAELPERRERKAEDGKISDDIARGVDLPPWVLRHTVGWNRLVPKASNWVAGEDRHKQGCDAPCHDNDERPEKAVNVAVDGEDALIL